MQTKREEMLSDIKPCLKWAGGKRALLKDIYELVPQQFNKYYEPFFGGGALFFALLPKRAIISDLNEDLINVYKQIKENADMLIEKLKKTKNTKDFYLKMRSTVFDDDIDKAVRFIYLNKTCWNGLYRVNSKGEFNVPFANYKNPTICNEELLKNLSNSLKNVKILTGDFEKILKTAKNGDFVYLDPPYTVTHSKNFVAYNSKIFSWEDQVRLVNLVDKLTEKGVKVLVSNAKAPEIKKLYKNYKSKVVERTSVISADISKRNVVEEYLFYNYKLK